MGDAGCAIIYRLKVSLRGISPIIWRRLLVPNDLTLYELHRVVQIAVDWEDYHLHSFRLHGRRYETMWRGPSQCWGLVGGGWLVRRRAEDAVDVGDTQVDDGLGACL